MQYVEKILGPGVDASVTFTIEDYAGGRDLDITVENDGQGAFVVWLDTPDWEPNASRLRLSVNDNPVFGYTED